MIGPEAPLAAGVADACAAAGIAVFGPSRPAARIETSKAFCREVAEAAGVPMARGALVRRTRLARARAFAADLAAVGTGVVVKADGLAAGKGVTVCDASLAEADAALAPRSSTSGGRCRQRPGARVVVIEERLIGLEASVIALCDGRDALALPAARDHKRLGDGDSGPNTGGMGAYSPLPDLPDEPVEAVIAGIHRPLLAELARRGRAVPRRPLRRPDPHRRRPGPARVQCPLRRPGDAGRSCRAWRCRSGRSCGQQPAGSWPRRPPGSACRAGRLLPALPGAPPSGSSWPRAGYPEAARAGRSRFDGLATRPRAPGPRLPVGHQPASRRRLRTSRRAGADGRRAGADLAAARAVGRSAADADRIRRRAAPPRHRRRSAQGAARRPAAGPAAGARR